MPAGKNRPHWRMPLVNYPKINSKPPANPIHFGEFPEHMLCRAIARSTGERCRCVAIHGSRHCKHHGGYWTGVRVEREAIGKDRFVSKAAARYGRAIFAATGAKNPGDDPSIIRRGKRASQLNCTDEAD